MGERAAGQLGEYRRRRDFAKTTEPKGGASRSAGKRRFVIQKHDARRLHFDFRLELDGVLKSWAVTRGPSTDPQERRLAVRTEDHPLDYADFEGTIPEGQYGGGTVMLWDSGRWTPIGDPRAGLRKGRLRFELDGERLQGGWTLVRIRPRGGEQRENWLLIKRRDGWAEADSDPVERFDTSIRSGREMAAIANAPGPATRQAKRRRNGGNSPPAFVKPALATLVDAPPHGKGWLHEVKWDGYRALAAVGGDAIRVYSRSGQDWTGRFEHLLPALSGLGVEQALIDGEVVAFDDDGHSSFSALQQALGEGGSITFMAFDLLLLDGADLRRKPLSERKTRLAKLVGKGDEGLRYCDHLEASGQDAFDSACELALEGIISKRADRPYRSGRHRDWLKIKCAHQEEFVIGGFRPSRVAGRPLSSLLLGTFEGDKLVYRGRVGTGFDGDTLDELGRKLRPLARRSPAYHEVPRDIARDARWVEPRLVAQITYRELTKDGLVRQAVFQGLREDKSARSVSLETAAGPASDLDAGRKPRGVRLTNPDKVLYQQQGITKAALAGYLQAVAAVMLPHAGARPVSLVRCPQGRSRKCFFQRHHASGLPDALKPFLVEQKSGGTEPYLYLEDEQGLTALAQIGALELHIWGAPVAHHERPDRLVFDLDPDPALPFVELKRAARDLRTLLEAAALQSFPLLTGGKGIHLVVPLAPKLGWEAVKGFARGMARALAESEPDRFVARAAKSARGGRIFIDWMRNERGATAICPYSPRARDGASVAVPVAWHELSRIKSAQSYDIETARRRLDRLKRDPWQGYFRLKQTIAPGSLQLFGAEDR